MGQHDINPTSLGPNKFLNDELQAATENYRNALNRFNALSLNDEYTDLVTLELKRAEIDIQIAIARAKIARHESMRTSLFKDVIVQQSMTV